MKNETMNERCGVAGSARAIQALFGHEIRIELMQLLAHSPADVSTLARQLDLDIGTVSHHLGILRQQSFVNSASKGNRRIYTLGDAVSAQRRGDALWLATKPGCGAAVFFRCPQTNGVNGRA